MVSAKRAICGSIIFIIGSYLLFGKNAIFSPIILSDTRETVYFYVTFWLLAVTILAGFLVYKDLLVGGILAIICAGIIMIWDVSNLIVGWSGGTYTSELMLSHLHTIIIELFFPALILTFGIIGLGKGEASQT